MKTVAVYPRLVEEWHPTKNGDLTPDTVSYGSAKKIWWKCPVAEDHEWEMSPNARTRAGENRNCPCCSGHKVVKSNALATTHPALAKEWHPTKNGSLTPNDVVAGSNKRCWWKCPVADDHEWVVSPNKRALSGHQCPYCCGQMVCLSNCLATTHPRLAEQWHPNKNGQLTPFSIVSGTNKKVWWKCPVAEDHEWIATVHSRASGRNCPCCGGVKVVNSNCLAITHPHLARQWHPTKNGDVTPFDVVAGGKGSYWWRCLLVEDHEWSAPLHHRKKGRGCPCCRGIKAVLSNCLATTHPHLAKQWHSMRNGSLTPSDVTKGTHKKVWWQCDDVKDHVWYVSPTSRTSNESNCPFCLRHRGETAVAHYLHTRGYDYSSQVRFSDCRKVRPLPFDFVVWLGNPFCCIEYQGPHHYVDWHHEVEFTQERDEIKREWCRSKGVLLLEIPYWKLHDIDHVLDDFLVSYLNNPAPRSPGHPSF